MSIKNKLQHLITNHAGLLVNSYSLSKTNSTQI